MISKIKETIVYYWTNTSLVTKLLWLTAILICIASIWIGISTGTLIMNPLHPMQNIGLRVFYGVAAGLSTICSFWAAKRTSDETHKFGPKHIPDALAKALKSIGE